MRGDLLVCAGSLTLDNVVTAAGAPLPRSPGGNVIYSALGARVWHDRVGLVSRAGADFPQDCLDALVARGLLVEGIRRRAEPHGMNVAFCYAPDGNRVRAFPPEVVAALPAEDRERFVDYTTRGTAHRFATWTAFAPEGGDVPVSWRRAAGLHCAAMPVERHLSIAAIARAAGTAWVQVDSPWYDERALGQDHGARLFPLLDALLPSEDDVAKADPGRPVEDTVDDLVARGARLVVLKRGARGCLLWRSDGGRERVPALRDAAAVDLTGAGDAFCGGFLAGLHRTGDPREAARHGTVSASFAIEAPGIAGLLAADPDEAARRLERLRRQPVD